MGLALALEEAGVPTVPVNTNAFARLAKATALAGGMPTLRNVFVPQPLVGLDADKLRDYVEGNDPVSKRPFTCARLLNTRNCGAKPVASEAV